MTGQNRKDPFHVNRDVVRDNVRVVRKLRLPRGAQIRARAQFASVNNYNPGSSVNMPYTGHLFLTVSGGGNSILINNPFVKSSAIPVEVSPSVPGGISVTGPGQITLAGAVAASGTPYEIVVGRATDARIPNVFSQ